MRSFLIFLLLCSLFPVLTFAENDNQLEIKKINLQKEELLHYQLSFIDSALIDKKKLEKLMHSLESEIAVTPINASYDENQRIIEGKQGKTLDRYTFKVRFIEAFYKEEDVQLEIPVKFVEPRIDAALLQEISQKNLAVILRILIPVIKKEQIILCFLQMQLMEQLYFLVKFSHLIKLLAKERRREGTNVLL